MGPQSHEYDISEMQWGNFKYGTIDLVPKRQKSRLLWLHTHSTSLAITQEFKQ